MDIDKSERLAASCTLPKGWTNYLDDTTAKGAVKTEVIVSGWETFRNGSYNF